MTFTASGDNEDMNKESERVALRKRKRVLIGALIAAVVAGAAVILILGGKLTPVSTNHVNPPLVLQVFPVISSWPPLVPSSGCPFPPGAGMVDHGHVAENESPVKMRVTVTSGTKVTGATIEVLGDEAYLPSLYATCARTLPRFTGTPNGWQVVQLPTGPSTVPIPHVSIPDVSFLHIRLSRTFNLVVQPPSGQMFAGVEYVWLINVTYKGRDGSGMYSSSLFVTLAPPS